MEDRLERFEAMLAAISQNYEITSAKMEQLRTQGKEKTVTFRQLMTDKMMFRSMLGYYQAYGLLERPEKQETHD